MTCRKHRLYTNPKYILNKIVRQLHAKNMLPAIVFVFSRKKAQNLAETIEMSLFPEDMAVNVEKECRKIMLKLPNNKEYTNLPEFHMIIQLLQKGIAVHHSGVLPVFREMIEIMFEKGFIKLLFATETFAVGVNMPTKTVLFTGLEKYDGQGNEGHFRYLHAHEYTQMAGRAGRRGLDKIGHVILLQNLFDFPNYSEMSHMLNGKPQTLESKFEIHYNMIFRLILQEQFDFEGFASNSMLHNELKKQVLYYEDKKQEKMKDIEKKEQSLYLISDKELLLEVDQKHYEMSKLKNKKRRRVLNEINNMFDLHRNLKSQYDKYKEIQEEKNEVYNLENDAKQTDSYVNTCIDNVKDILRKLEFLKEDTLTKYGEIAVQFNEIHCLAGTYLYFNTDLKSLSVNELTSLLAVFCDVRFDKSESKKDNSSQQLKPSPPPPPPLPIESSSTDINTIISQVKDFVYKLEKEEQAYNYTSEYVDFSEQFCDIIYSWCEADSTEKAQEVIQKANMYGLYLGNFVRAVLKIYNISLELEKVCEFDNNIELLEKVKKIPEKILKFVVTSQSLYI